ncbi:MAG: hypothetical protein COT85_06445 [Chlamydiae bacterium CG10_big_fil_rev_8_21_14_0_10_42_34]|nr:MAG: hypothetical protein COT85_06445 [Chlamydiae bacterium CG10_big_fil_rev_8_21_14_0_10_42_34]
MTRGISSIFSDCWTELAGEIHKKQNNMKKIVFRTVASFLHLQIAVKKMGGRGIKGLITFDETP